MNNSYHIQYQKLNNGKAKLLRIHAASAHITIPQTVDGYPIVEIAPYCFCENNRIEYTDIKDEIIGSTARLQEICGNALEEIVLPDSIEKIGNYAFYNCKKLRKIEFSANTTEIGSDAFMNTISLHQLTFRCAPSEKSGIKQILAHFSSDIEVIFLENNEIKARLLYPEYYESYDEIAPAHLFGRNIEGEGFRARQCIQDGIVDFVGYDSIFEQACVDESEKILNKMALNRLQYPYALKEMDKKMYRKYLEENILPEHVYGRMLDKNKSSFLYQLIEERELEVLRFLCHEKILTGEKLNRTIALASEAEWAEGAAELLQFKAKQTDKNSRYSFDDF